MDFSIATDINWWLLSETQFEKFKQTQDHRLLNIISKSRVYLNSIFWDKPGQTWYGYRNSKEANRFMEWLQENYSAQYETLRVLLLLYDNPGSGFAALSISDRIDEQMCAICNAELKQQESIILVEAQKIWKSIKEELADCNVLHIGYKAALFLRKRRAVF